MSIEIRTTTLVWDGFNCRAIEPNTIFPNPSKVRKYIKLNPFPESQTYTTEDLIGDTQSEGSWTLGNDVTEKQKEYIVTITQHFAGC